MDPAQHLATLRTETARVAALPADALDAPVPALPDWTVERVVRHVGKVHQWVAAVLRLPAGAGMDGVDTATLAGIPTGPGALAAYAESADDLLAAF
ncbi:MAG: maleylpyruvate isomerase N-terminal domain-containing protein, partial [Acidimicrobiales bacterium]|nr:maleylpyruvate isomerase N-terminal domain-containing protein [Acidimicrobiales bacterium]